MFKKEGKEERNRGPPLTKNLSKAYDTIFSLPPMSVSGLSRGSSVIFLSIKASAASTISGGVDACRRVW